MTALPFHAVPVLVDDQPRLRVYRGRNLEIEVPLGPRQALVLAALLLNHALMAERSGPDRLMTETGDKQRAADGPKCHNHAE
jgi:hypothetical protein